MEGPSSKEARPLPDRTLRQSSRLTSSKRFRYEPQSIGQGPKDLSGLNVVSVDTIPSQHLIVDTGASHVLFRQQDLSILYHIQWSASRETPFAILKAANGVLLDSIGRGMLIINTVTVIAYIFRDTDLEHNLLGIAPFADKGCTAIFSATKFSLFRHDKVPILVGERHDNHLWRITMPKKRTHTNAKNHIQPLRAL
jgi:hypothetical protein